MSNAILQGLSGLSLPPVILNMSIAGSVMILIVFLARLILKKAPKVFSYVLWAVVLFRLLCPVSVATDFSVLGLLHTPVTENTKHTTTVEYVSYDTAKRYAMGAPYSEQPAAAGQEMQEPGTPPSSQPAAAGEAKDASTRETAAPGADPMKAGTPIGSVIWLTGIGVMIFYSAVSYFRLRRKLIGTVRLRDNIYLVDGIGSPFVLGIFRPAIYLPSSLSEQEQGYIILHERYHIRRGDHIIKVLAFIALCIHWFNPFVWAAFVLSSKDMEMSCDEAVVKKLGDSICADYSSSLLSLATGRRIIAGTPLAFGEGDTESRIKNILGWKKPKVWITIAAAMVSVFVLAACAGNPAGKSDPPNASVSEDTAENRIDESTEDTAGDNVVGSDRNDSQNDSAQNPGEQSAAREMPDQIKDVVYHLELAAGERFREMNPEMQTGILSECGDLLDDYVLIARESEDGKTAYIAGQYIGESENPSLYGKYSVELSAPGEDYFQYIYREEDSKAVEEALAGNEIDSLPKTGYRIDNSLILWSAGGGSVLIQPNDTEYNLIDPFLIYFNRPNGREYIEDAASRGIDVCGKTDIYLCVNRISEQFGELSERIPLTELEADRIDGEEKVSIGDGFGFSAVINVGNRSTLYDEHSGVPQTILDLAAEKCDYRFESPEMIGDTIREARLDCEWLKEPILANEEDLPRLREILKNAKFGYVGGCGYAAKLTMTFDDGGKMFVFKGCDGCDTIVFGSYGGYFLGKEENLEFWKIFGLDPETKQKTDTDSAAQT